MKFVIGFHLILLGLYLYCFISLLLEDIGHCYASFGNIIPLFTTPWKKDKDGILIDFGLT